MRDWPQTVGVVGCGAMGGAMAAGFARGAPDVADGMVVADAIPAAASRVAAEVGARTGTLAEAAGCDLVCLAVKPKDAEAALRAIAPDMSRGAVLMSVVAGWPIDRISRLAPGVAVVRAMPNLAVRHGAGLVAVADRDMPEGRNEELIAFLEPLGAVLELPEHQLGPATALVGSGPGFLALVAEGLEDGAVAVGFTRDQARTMVQAVIAGTAALLEGGTDPGDLRQRVSSPAGTTVEGVGVLERGAVRAHIADAVRAAARRADEL